MASPAGNWLNAKTDRVGRVIVGPDLKVPGLPEVFVLGDAASVSGPDGKPLPGVAPVAKQEGAYVATLIITELLGKPTLPFRYRHYGSLATIGRKNAVVEMGDFRFSGLIAWLTWCVAHIYFLIGFRNRLAVTLNWGWNYLTFQRGTRLITGPTGSHVGVAAALGEPSSDRALAKNSLCNAA